MDDVSDAILIPTRLVYQAALASGHNPPPVGDVPDARCWLCAGPTYGRGRLVKDVISHTFTDPDFARGGGQSICQACMFVLKHKPFRTRSVLATPAGLRQPMRTDWREILVSPPEPPWVGTIALSGQKHLVFKSRVNASNDAPVVAVEETLTPFIPAQFAADAALLERLLVVFSKTELRTGSYQPHRIQQFGLAEFPAAAVAVDTLRRQRRRFDLALLLAQIPERATAVTTAKAAPMVAVKRQQTTQREAVTSDDGLQDLPLFSSEAETAV